MLEHLNLSELNSKLQEKEKELNEHLKPNVLTLKETKDIENRKIYERNNILNKNKPRNSEKIQ